MLRIGDTNNGMTIHVPGDANTGKARCRIEKGPDQSGSVRGRLLCTTKLTDEEILDWVKKNWDDNYSYDLLTHNCQTFVRRVTDGLFKVPAHVLPRETATEGKAELEFAEGRITRSASGSELKADGVLLDTRANLGIFGADATLLRGAISTKGDIPHYAQAEVAKVGANVGPIRVAAKLDGTTGIRVEDGNFETRLLGFGFSIGRRGLMLSTPFLEGGIGGQR